MSKQRLTGFITQWLIEHGTNRVVQYQLGVFNMDLYYKSVRLDYLETTYDKNENEFYVRLTQKGLDYLKENTK